MHAYKYVCMSVGRYVGIYVGVCRYGGMAVSYGGMWVCTWVYAFVGMFDTRVTCGSCAIIYVRPLKLTKKQN